MTAGRHNPATSDVLYEQGAAPILLPEPEMRPFIVLALLLSCSCASHDPLGPDFHEELIRLGGCADVLFYAVDADDELMLSFRTDGLVEEARSAGEPRVTTFALPDATVELVLERGRRVSDVTCDDVVEQGGPRIDRTWSAISGTASVAVRPGAEVHDARADLVLEDVVLEGEGGARVEVPRMEWTDTPVGWFPG